MFRCCLLEQTVEQTLDWDAMMVIWLRRNNNPFLGGFPSWRAIDADLWCFLGSLRIKLWNKQSSDRWLEMLGPIMICMECYRYAPLVSEANTKFNFLPHCDMRSCFINQTQAEFVHLMKSQHLFSNIIWQHTTLLTCSSKVDSIWSGAVLSWMDSRIILSGLKIKIYVTMDL